MSKETAINLLRDLHTDQAKHAELQLELMLQVDAELPRHDTDTIEDYARKMANKYGAFPYDGPVGNGLRRSHYQERFREMAFEQILVITEFNDLDISWEEE